MFLRRRGFGKSGTCFGASLLAWWEVSILSTQTVVVTGASAGAGRAIAHRFARAGARVGLIARDATALDAVADEVERLGGQACPAAADVADPDALFEAAARIRGTLGAADVWVNDAMVTVFAPFAALTPEEFRRVTEVTYLGYVHGTMAALRQMRPRNKGVIVQVGSALAYRGIPLQSAYCGAKHAIRGFTEAIRTELLHERRNIAITMVQLPAVNTPQFDWARSHMRRLPRPMGLTFQPEVVADAVFHAAHRPRPEYWLGRTTVLTVLGNMLLPGLLDRILARTGYRGQERPLPASPERPDNLLRPVGPFHRTHGAFDREAHAHALLVPATVARLGALALGSAAILAIGLAAAKARGRLARSTEPVDPAGRGTMPTKALFS